MMKEFAKKNAVALVCATAIVVLIIWLSQSAKAQKKRVLELEEALKKQNEALGNLQGSLPSEEEMEVMKADTEKFYRVIKSNAKISELVENAELISRAIENYKANENQL